MTYKLQIKLDEDMPELIKEYYKNLTLGNFKRTDSGIDLPVIKNYRIPNFERETFNFGIKCQLLKYTDSEENSQFVPYYLYPRSSISKTPLIQTNSLGIIDKDYRGNIMAKVLCIRSPSMTWIQPEYEVREMQLDSKEYLVNEGTRLFQLCTTDLSPINVEIVENLTETSRGEGGFGSTGVSI